MASFKGGLKIILNNQDTIFACVLKKQPDVASVREIALEKVADRLNFEINDLERNFLAGGIPIRYLNFEPSLDIHVNIEDWEELATGDVITCCTYGMSSSSKNMFCKTNLVLITLNIHLHKYSCVLCQNIPILRITFRHT